MDHAGSRQQQAEATRQKIFLCAQEMFAVSSYESVKISDICRRAGVSIGSFYHHFPNKESLLNEGYRLFDSNLRTHWLEQKLGPGLETMRFLVRFQLESIWERGPVSAAKYFKNQLDNEDKYILDKGRFFYRKMLEHVELALAAGRLRGEAESITDDILRATRGLIYDWCLHGGGYALVEEGLRSLEMVLLYHSPR